MRVLKSAVIFFSLFLPLAAAADMQDLSSIFIPGKQKTTVLGHGTYFPRANNGANSTQITETGLSITTPLYQDEKNVVNIHGHYDDMALQTNAILPRDLTPLPDHLRNIGFGTNFTHILDGQKFWGLGVNYGSASDKPFSGSNVQTIGMNIYYGFPSSDVSRWVLLMNFSNNRAFLNNIPLPGFAYIYAPSKTFRGIFGIPFAMVHWEFEPRWILTLLEVGVTKSKLELAYAVAGPAQIFIAGDFGQQPFLRKGRGNSKDRLTYDEKRVFLGARSPLSQVFGLELDGGYAFDRSFFETDRYFKRNDNSIKLANSWFANAEIGARF